MFQRSFQMKEWQKVIDVFWEYEYLKDQVNNTDEGDCAIGIYNKINVIEAYSWRDYVLSP